MSRIHLGYNASRPIGPQEASAMRPCLEEALGNPSSGQWDGLCERVRVVLNGHAECRLPNTLDVAFPGAVRSELLKEFDGIAASTGSACHAGRVGMSPQLRAMDIAPEVGMGAIRFSLGRHTMGAEIDTVLERLTAALTPVP